MPPTKAKKDWMEFINDFVISFGKKLIDIVHEYGKKAYVFYDDSWVGVNHIMTDFMNLVLMGLLNAYFPGMKLTSLCRCVNTEVHELRASSLSFPGGAWRSSHLQREEILQGMQYWRNVRRALLREPIQRID